MTKTIAGGIFPPEEFPPLPIHDKPGAQPTLLEPKPTQYAKILNPKPTTPLIPKVSPKPVIIIHGEPSITWKTSEVKSLIAQENLQYAIIGKFSYGKPEIQELRRSIPGQCGIKSECTIGVLDTRHILIRLTTMEDYVQLLSTAAFYIKAKENYWQMRTLKWDTWFEPEVETTIGVAWISFPDLPPNFFAKEAIFSIASAVGKPLTVDMATKNQTRPSCARVKIEVDLTARLPQRVKINEEDDITGHIKSKWIKIQYDYLPKYCNECCLQGHDEHNCWALHPELLDVRDKTDGQEKETEKLGTAAEQRRILASGRVVGNKQNKQEWMVSRRNKYKRDRTGRIEGEIDYHDGNTFDALREKDETDPADNLDKIIEEGTKEWVNKTFTESRNTCDQQAKEKQCEEKARKSIKQKENDVESGLTQSLDHEQYGNQGERIELKGAEDAEQNKGTIVVYEIKNEEVLPLAFHDNHSGGEEHGTNQDKGELMTIINKVAIEGDLSPKHVGKLKDTHTRQKNHSAKDTVGVQASSRQSKRVIIKNSKYQ
uniref:Putative ovule protein n=1 Tax=Solanum chacoense TaxID=4108 RepID=A0A0V0IDF8_SOLCH